MRRSSLRMAGLGVAVALAIGSVGCGRSDGEDIAVVRQIDLLQASEEAGSARVAITVEVTPEAARGQAATRITSTSEGIIELGSLTSDLTGSFTIATDWPDNAVDQPRTLPTRHFEARTIEADAFTRTWEEGTDPGPWFAVPEMRSKDRLLERATQIDPHAFLEKVREVASEVTETGTDEVRGTATTRYEITVDTADLGPEADRWGITGIDPVTIAAWVDSDDLLRKVEAGPMTIELWDYGVPVDIAAPSDVTDDPEVFDLGGVLPEVTGDWTEQASGSTAGADWTLFAAPALIGDDVTVCRSLEVAGQGDQLAALFAEFGEDSPVPHHDGRLASCGSGLLSLAIGGFVPEPSVQLVSPLFGGIGGPQLTALVVDPDLASAGVALETDAGVTDLAVDAAGVVVLGSVDASAAQAVVLDGGGVTCPVNHLPERADSGSGRRSPLSGLALGLGPCVLG